MPCESRWSGLSREGVGGENVVELVASEVVGEGNVECESE